LIARMLKEEFASRDTLALSFPRGLWAQFAVDIGKMVLIII
jgi:hypothetical protein